MYVFGNYVASLLEVKHFTQHIAGTWIAKPHWSTLILELHLRQVFLGTLCHAAQLEDCKYRAFPEANVKKFVLLCPEQSPFSNTQHRNCTCGIDPGYHTYPDHLNIGSLLILLTTNLIYPPMEILSQFSGIEIERGGGKHKFTGD